ncbi:ATP synthase F1 subunit gamma [Candidatus Sumerlaeota bacterium]|nr:ATP synthase F1 subunit gamma [Candidatus Sumerlaeota bacterium]
MPSLKDIRRRLRTVISTQKITRAMETVSAVKLRRAQERLFAARPYADRLAAIVQALSEDETAAEHPLCQARAVHHRTLIVITADRGLCGAFNTNLLKQADTFLAEHGTEDLDVVPMGKRANTHCRRKGWTVIDRVAEIGGQASAQVAGEVARRLIARFTAGETDEVWILTTRMLSLIRFEPHFERLLPLALGKDERRTGEYCLNYLFEPGAAEVLGTVLPRTAESRLYLALAESVASEHSARRMSMHNATENCKDLSQQLTLDINKARQASITTELGEIVGGAEALKG